MNLNDSHQRLNKLPKTQSGYILVLTIVLLAALLVISLNFLQRSSDSLQITGYNRQSSESLVLAENALNMLYGQFVYNADLDNDGTKDNDERIFLGNLNNIPLHYLYYVSSGNDIDQQFPSILQKVANGEAKGNGSNISDHIINANTAELLVANLYSTKAKPIIYVLDQNGKYVVSNNTWSELNNNTSNVAAAWLELVKNENLAGTFQVYVQAVGKVGTSRSYVQRLIGNYPTTLGSNLGGLNESSL